MMAGQMKNVILSARKLLTIVLNSRDTFILVLAVARETPLLHARRLFKNNNSSRQPRKCFWLAFYLYVVKKFNIQYF